MDYQNHSLYEETCDILDTYGYIEESYEELLKEVPETLKFKWFCQHDDDERKMYLIMSQLLNDWRYEERKKWPLNSNGRNLKLYRWLKNKRIKKRDNIQLYKSLTEEELDSLEEEATQYLLEQK